MYKGMEYVGFTKSDVQKKVILKSPKSSDENF